jgi:hypothetical protein
MDSVFWLVFLATYAYVALSLQTIAGKTGTKDGWMAWVPFANLWLMCKIAGKPGWWVILFLIPVVNIVITVLVWMGIAEARKKPAWYGVLIIVPIASLIVPGTLAFTD